MIKLKLRPGQLPEGMPFMHPAALIATGLGSGLIPIAPGTWASLFTLPFGWLIGSLWGTTGLLIAAIVAAGTGIWASSVLVARGDVHDPGYIVIDEVAGMLVTLVLTPLTWWGVLLGFLLFRAADIFKPFPADWCDRNLHGGFGVMMDDIVAGIYAAIACYFFSEYVIRGYLLAPVGVAS